LIDDNNKLLFDGTKEDAPIPKARTQKLPIRSQRKGGTSEGLSGWVLKDFLFQARYCVPGNNPIRHSASEEGITIHVEAAIIETFLGVVFPLGGLRKGSDGRFRSPQIIDPCGSIIIANGNSLSIWRKGDAVCIRFRTRCLPLDSFKSD